MNCTNSIALCIKWNVTDNIRRSLDSSRILLPANNWNKCLIIFLKHGCFHCIKQLMHGKKIYDEDKHSLTSLDSSEELQLMSYQNLTGQQIPSISCISMYFAIRIIILYIDYYLKTALIHLEAIPYGTNILYHFYHKKWM